MNSVILKPRLSEKSYGQSQVLNTYAFDVSGDANRHTIAQTVSEQYDVTVVKVNIANINGKNKRTFINKRGRFVKGQRSDIKKAYVTLKEGDKLDIFAQEEAEEAKLEKAAEKAAKKAAKEKR